ncbi:TetR/AcrR family transcriptional regulator [Pseudonocardia spinosispora]|uniref:TetR/AcrR family transcriptional regulator n=1 Tax=Pseudonocardia spinosispora TaxID=103441 RepID=UPI00040343C4|nr:TetR/AcrR family transcriptional regulator [Pseudonocardia spinosispora]
MLPDRRNRILDAAERVFAEEGYHGTALREIAKAADVKLSLIGYHFESKLILYTAVFERRQHVNDERQELLEKVEDLTAPDALERIVAAFMDPVIQLDDDGIWYRKLVLREASDPSSRERKVISGLFDPMARRFIEALKGALPGKRPGFYEWAYLFAVGALTQSAFDDRIAALGGEPGAARKNDVLRSFITAALRYG